MTNSILNDTFDFLFGPSFERLIRQAINEVHPELTGEEECAHEWTDKVETCRNCGGTDIQLVALNSSDALPGVLHAPAESIYGSFCTKCQGLTMASLASHCMLCGEIDWGVDMDEEIFGE